MPELPDVQVFREYLDATSLHREITGVHLRDADEILEGVSGSTLRRRLKGRSFRSTRRHGKHLFAELRAGEEQDGWLHLHFGMTGTLKFSRKEPEEDPGPVKLQVDFRDGARLAYLNTRKLGSLGLLEDVDEFVEREGLGPDARGVSREELREMLEGRRGTIKGALMNQGLLAGLGNVYTDEILFQAGIHPETKAGTVSSERVRDLHSSLKRVLDDAILARVEEFPSDFLVPTREEGSECSQCGGTIEKIRVSGRPTYLCPDHQELIS